MSSITSLPEEIITIILGYDNIKIEDIVNLRLTCKQFRWAADSKKLIHKKFSQRWPNGKKYYDKESKIKQMEFEKETEEESKEELEDLMIMKKNFIEMGKYSVNLSREIMSKILDKHYSVNDSIDNTTYFTKVFKIEETTERKIDGIAGNLIINTCITDEIKYLLTTQSPQEAGCDLTERYYNTKLYYYLRQSVLSAKWKRFKTKPPKEQLMEQAAIILAQYLQPEKDIFYLRVKASLSTIAKNALNLFRTKYPDHSIFRTSAEHFSYWENNNIYDNHWDEAEGSQIMDTLQEYIDSVFNFHPRSCNGKVEDACIDKIIMDNSISQGDEYENVLQDELDYLINNQDELDKSNESEDTIINENNGGEIKSITIEETTGQSEMDKEIMEFKNVLEDGLDHLLINAMIEFETQMEYKKKECKKENKKENNKRKDNNDDNKKKKHKKLM